MNDVAKLIPNKSDAEKAADFKTHIVEALIPAIAILNEAQTHGLTIQYSIGPDAMGKHHVVQLDVVRKF